MENKPYNFRCKECNYQIAINEYDDPTTSTGSCPCCGGSKWNIFDKATGRTIA